MTSFLSFAVLMTLLALACVLPALLRCEGRSGGPSRAATNATIHAAELAQLERDLAAGAIGAEAYRAARDEVLRRVLTEGAPEAPLPMARAVRAPAAVVAIAVPVVAGVLYLLVGNPAALQQARAVDITVPGSGLSATAMADELESHLRRAPRDGRAWVLLGRLNMNANRYAAAAHAYEQALAAAPKIARDPGIWCELADAVGMAQGGRLDGRPREFIERALSLKGDHPRALEMAGSAAYEAGHYRDTVAHWSALLAQLAPDSAEHRELQIAVARVRSRLPGETQIR